MDELQNVMKTRLVELSNDIKLTVYFIWSCSQSSNEVTVQGGQITVFHRFGISKAFEACWWYGGVFSATRTC